ncbi:HU family DNA-binding protein [Pseudohalocynthiibacter sp. F2068]|jgi:nucleoid DNA-binding protein|nr:HU family DNA-binding protein [Pseudohalocynthiibacter sp. F2068]
MVKTTTKTRSVKTRKKPTSVRSAKKPAATAKPATMVSVSPEAAVKTAATKTAAVVATTASDSVQIGEVRELRKKELIERVVARSGIKKKDAKPVIEAMLAVLGASLADGDDFVLPPFGKVKVKRTKEQPGAKVFTCRIRQSDSWTTPLVNPLIDAAE